MKKSYSKPAARKIEFSYTNQVMAQSGQVADWGDPWDIKKCTWQIDSNCSVIFNKPSGVMTLGLDDCTNQGRS